MVEITSVSNQLVKRAARLRKRAFRLETSQFLAEGPQAVREALRRPELVEMVFATAAASQRHADLRQAATHAGIAWHQAAGIVLEALSDTVTPQGVVAICRSPLVSLAELSLPENPLVVILAHVRDPGNVGTVIRVADGAGAAAVLVTDASVDPLNPKAVRASAGSVFHLPIVTGVPVAAAVAYAQDAGMSVFAAEGEQGTLLGELAGELRGPTAWLFGNEAWGLPDEVVALADHRAAIPIYGRAESLNLATAAAVCLYASAAMMRSDNVAPGVVTAIA